MSSSAAAEMPEPDQTSAPAAQSGPQTPDAELPRAVRESVRFNADGLVPVITQDAETSEVLMLAWMNEEALGITLATGSGVYFSRSRQELWRKGATSGNVQQVVSLALDCDGDTVLMRVQQSGPACHTGTTACFTGREITHA